MPCPVACCLGSGFLVFFGFLFFLYGQGDYRFCALSFPAFHPYPVFRPIQQLDPIIYVINPNPCEMFFLAGLTSANQLLKLLWRHPYAVITHLQDQAPSLPPGKDLDIPTLPLRLSMEERILHKGLQD